MQFEGVETTSPVNGVPVKYYAPDHRIATNVLSVVGVSLYSLWAFEPSHSQFHCTSGDHRVVRVPDTVRGGRRVCGAVPSEFGPACALIYALWEELHSVSVGADPGRIHPG